MSDEIAFIPHLELEMANATLVLWRSRFGSVGLGWRDAVS